MNENNQKLLKRYLALRGNNVTERSKQAFNWDLNVFIRYIGDKPLSEVTHIDIDDFFQYCVEERKNKDEALSRKYNTLNTFFKTMIKKEYLDMKNPLDKVEKIKVRKKVRGHVAIDEYKTIINYLEEINDKRGLALYSLLFSSGIRISEVYRLNRDDIDFENKEFVVLGKGDKEGICILSDEAVNYIQQYLSTRDDDLEALFISREHNRWSVKAMQDFVKKAAARAGINKNIHPHLLRHGTAMMLLENGLPIDEIQKVLRHSNISTTQIYAVTSINRVKKNVSNIYDKIL